MQWKPNPEWTPRLVDWYCQVRRPFPWRVEPTPYRVWVSEIMLQQTRIEAALGYYERFMEALPTVADLAAVDEDTLLKLWEGLGYYSRAKNLRKAAIQIMEHYGGELPASFEALLQLPGIGEYTAGAIASIAYDLAVPAVDGNVLRVLARLTACSEDVLKPAVKKELSKLAAALVPEKNPGLFNEAIMELGETVCLPNTTPDCTACPLYGLCEAQKQGCAGELPVRSPKKERRVEHRTVLVIIRKRDNAWTVLLHKRPSAGLLGGLWELPSVDGEMPDEAVRELVIQWTGGRILDTEDLGKARHLFSHIEWHMEGRAVWLEDAHTPSDCVWADADEIRDVYALPSAFRAYAQKLPAILKKEKGL